MNAAPEKASQLLPHIQDCIKACQQGHNICLDTIDYCLQQGGAHTEEHHLRLLMDCAEICQTSANFMLRGSDFHDLTSAACAAICRAGAESCDQFGYDARMKQCLEACRRCAESCQQMVEMMKL